MVDWEQHLEADEAGGIVIVHYKLRLVLFAEDLFSLWIYPEALQVLPKLEPPSITKIGVSRYYQNWSLQVNKDCLLLMAKSN